MPNKKEFSTVFLIKTNQEYAAWCATIYIPECLDRRGMKNLDGLWAWQEQQTKIDALESEMARLKEENKMLEGLTKTMPQEILDLEKKS